jgi:uncharacterized membrane protein
MAVGEVAVVKKRRQAPEPTLHAPQQLERNIAAIARLEQTALEHRSLADRLGGAIGLFAGSITFVVLQLGVFAGWILLNRPASTVDFDPYPYNWLNLILGLEAILLSTFVLINQQQMQKLADRRAHLNLQMSLLSESEMTKVLHTLRTLSDHLGVPGLKDDEELQDLSTRTELEHVAHALDEQLSGPSHPET